MGGDLIVHLDARDAVRSAGGRFAPCTGLDTVPGLTEEQAITLARLHWPQQLPDGKEPEVLRVELKVDCPGLTLNDGSLDQFLVWDVWLGASCGAPSLGPAPAPSPPPSQRHIRRRRMPRSEWVPVLGSHLHIRQFNRRTACRSEPCVVREGDGRDL